MSAIARELQNHTNDPKEEENNTFLQCDWPLTSLWAGSKDEGWWSALRQLDRVTSRARLCHLQGISDLIKNNLCICEWKLIEQRGWWRASGWFSVPCLVIFTQTQEGRMNHSLSDSFIPFQIMTWSKITCAFVNFTASLTNNSCTFLRWRLTDLHIRSQ